MPSCPMFGKGLRARRACPVTGQQSGMPETTDPSSSRQQSTSLPIQTDLSAVRTDIKHVLRSPGHDDGSLAPLFIRFAWHCSGTYDKTKKTGGSHGSTMRFQVEQQDPENNGLEKARDALRRVHERHPYMSLADIFVLAGYVAFEATGGPVIPFAVGRKDYTEEEASQIHGKSLCPFGDGAHNPCGSRLPAADLGPDPSCPTSAPAHKREKPTIDAMRGTFQRMGLSDRETVALVVMGHQYGRMHPEVSGYENTWYAFDPTHWNVYGPGGLGYLTAYSMQSQRLWPEHLSSKGKRQFSFRLGGGIFSMLPVDMALLWDADYRKIVLWYDKHRLEFHRDSALAWKKLTELGCHNLVPESTRGYDRICIDHIL